MYSPNTVTRLNEIAHEYRDLIHQSIHDVLSQPRYKNTGAGAASLTVDVIEGDSDKSPSIKITFADHLIFLEKRKIQWTKLPEMKKMIDWAETKRSDKAEAKKLAWATAWNKRKFDTWKPKAWRKRSLSSVMKEMNDMITKAYDEVINKDMAEASSV